MELPQPGCSNSETSNRCKFAARSPKLIAAPKVRLRVVSNFGDGDCGVGEIHTRAREISRRRDARGAPKIRDYRLSQGV